MKRQQRECFAAKCFGVASLVLAALLWSPTASAQTVTDNFNTAHDYQFGDTTGTIWTGMENIPLVTQTGVFDADTTNPDVLTIEDNGTFTTGAAPHGIGWEGNRSTAPFLFTDVPAGKDFIATVKISAQTSGQWSAAGLIARANSPTPPGTGMNNADENFVTMTSFRTAAANPDEGNTLMKKIQGGAQINDLSLGVNTTGTEPLPLVLKLERFGGVGYRGSVSTDGGSTYQFQSHTIPAADNALRDPTMGQQVGLSFMFFGGPDAAQAPDATASNKTKGTVQFDDFSLEILDPRPAPGMPVLSASQTTFDVPPGAAVQSLITDSTGQGFLEWVRTPNLPGTDGMFPSGLGPGAPVLTPPLIPFGPNQSVFYWNTTGRPVGETRTITITAINDWGQVSEPITLNVRIIPEPASLVLTGLMCAAAGMFRRRR
jgi:hypothetical protein